MPATTERPHFTSVKYQVQAVAKLVRAVDRQEAAIASGDRETVARIGRRLYSNDKAIKHRAYDAAAWLNRYVLGGEFGDRSDGRDVGYLGSVQDLRAVLRAVNVHYDLGRSAYRVVYADRATALRGRPGYPECRECGESSGHADDCSRFTS